MAQAKYINTETLEVKSQGEWRKIFTKMNISLPKTWTTSNLEGTNLAPVLAAPAPTVTELERTYQSGVTQDSKGNYVTSYVIVPKYTEYAETTEEILSTDIVDGEEVITYVEIIHTVDDQILATKKVEMLAELKAIYLEKSTRPEVLTSLGFTVHGGYQDLQDFEVGVALASTEIRDMDNVMHSGITITQFKKVVLEIKMHGAVVKRNKWTLTDTINSDTITLTELEALKLNEGWV